MISSNHSAFAALRHRDFRLLWLGQIVSVTGSQMQFVAINWHVYLLTKSAFALGLVGLFRGVPIIICSLAGGVVADAIDRKRLMIVTQTVMLASCGTADCRHACRLRKCLAHLPAQRNRFRSNSIRHPCPPGVDAHTRPDEDFPNAVSLGIIVFNVATIAGPAIAGFCLPKVDRQ